MSSEEDVRGEVMVARMRNIACILTVLLIVMMLPGQGFAYGNTSSDYTKTRLAGQNRYETSFKIADDLYRSEGDFQNVIIAYGQNFPDALAGGYLAMEKDAPILLTEPTKELDVLMYIISHAVPDAGVYLLGGTGVISTSLERQLNNAGYEVTRLGGSDRFETNLEILDAVHVRGKELLVSDGYGFADSLSGSAVGKPILIVNKNKGLSERQKAWLAQAGISKIYILGGTGSVSSDIQRQLQVYAPVKRLGGANRHETSALIAREFFPYANTVTIAYSGNFPDGLSGAPIALRARAPMLLVNEAGYMDAREYIAECGADSCYVIGGTGSISDSTVGYAMGEEIKVPDVTPETLAAWQSMYKKYLESHKSSLQYDDFSETLYDDTPLALHDFDGNGIPELVIGFEGARLGLSVYTIYGGKVVYAGSCGGKSVEYSDNANYQGVFRWDSEEAGRIGGVSYSALVNGRLNTKEIETFKYDVSSGERVETVKDVTLYNVYTSGTHELDFYTWSHIQLYGWDSFVEEYGYESQADPDGEGKSSLGKRTYFTQGGAEVSLELPGNWLAKKYSFTGEDIVFHEKNTYERKRTGDEQTDYNIGSICTLRCMTAEEFQSLNDFYRRWGENPTDNYYYYGKIGDRHYAMVWGTGYGYDPETETYMTEALEISEEVARTFQSTPETVK